jgi:hypothetical protein
MWSMKPLNLMSGVGDMKRNLNDDKNFIMMGEHPMHGLVPKYSWKLLIHELADDADNGEQQSKFCRSNYL